MQILCESCGAVVAGERIDLQRNLATCTACNQVFNGSLEREEQAVYMEQQLEAFLGIKDRRVAGEGRG